MLKNFRLLISFPYQLIHWLRCLLYALGILKRNKLGAFVISVGNASFGGTGKTPVTIELAKYLSATTDLNVAVLTRGYLSNKELTKDGPIILNKKFLDESGSKLVSKVNVEEIGDEAYLMWTSFMNAEEDITLVIDPMRYRGGREAIEKHNIDVFILDDGMQHIALDRDLDILLKNINEQGYYREFPFLADAKADYVFHTKVNEEWLGENPATLSVQYSISLMRDLDYSKGLLLFSGLGDSPSYFEQTLALIRSLPNGENYLKTRGFQLKAFPDHYKYMVEDVRELLSTGMNLVCTLKDYVKIPEDYRKWVIPVNLTVSINPKTVLEEIRGKVIDGTTNA